MSNKKRLCYSFFIRAAARVAEDHLQNSTMSVQQIAELCGFSDAPNFAPNFAQAFKRWTRQSPTVFSQKSGVI